MAAASRLLIVADDPAALGKESQTTGPPEFHSPA